MTRTFTWRGVTRRADGPKVVEVSRQAAELERVKDLCRRETRRAIADGRLVRQPCERCSKLKVQAHHDDYSKPLEVRWLCPVCHNHLHAERGERPGGWRPNAGRPKGTKDGDGRGRGAKRRVA